MNALPRPSAIVTEVVPPSCLTPIWIRSPTATDVAAEHAAVGGEGYWRIITEYESPSSFNQTIKIKASKKARFLPAKALKEVISGDRKLGPAPKPEPKPVAKPVAKKAAPKKAAKKTAKKAAPKKAAKKKSAPKKAAKKVVKKKKK